MARALHRVMPPIEIIQGSQYNIAPDASAGQIDAFLLKQLQRGGRNLSDLPTEVVTCPFVQVGGSH
jgi:magnesium chelatase subunit D